MMLAVTLMLTVGAPVALAKPAPPTGVHIDPGSPVAKEYAIPLASARGGGGSSGPGSGQLFGSGITRSRSTPPDGASTTPASTPRPASPASPAAAVTVAHAPAHRRAHRSRVHARAATNRPAAQVTAVPVAQLSGPARAGGSGGTGIVWMLGVAALVLAIGGIGGAAVTRYGRRTSARPS